MTAAPDDGAGRVITVLVIPADGQEPVQPQEVPASWQALYDIVGGSVSLVSVPGIQCGMFVDGRGKLRQAPKRNIRAEMLRNAFVRRAMDPALLDGPFGHDVVADWLAGDAVVFGDPEQVVGGGELPLSVPDSLVVEVR